MALRLDAATVSEIFTAAMRSSNSTNPFMSKITAAGQIEISFVFI
jgi:hypothetical protein